MTKIKQFFKISKNRFFIILISVLTIFCNTVLPVSAEKDKDGDSAATKKWESDDVDMGWLSYQMTDWSKLEDFLIFSSSIQTQSKIEEPKLEHEEVKAMADDIEKYLKEWTDNNTITVGEGCDELKDYKNLILCVIDAFYKPGDDLDKDPCKMLKYNVLECKSDYTANADSAKNTSRNMIDKKISIMLFIKALNTSMDAWALRTGTSKSTITLYSMDEHLKASLANIYFPNYIINYHDWYKDVKGKEKNAVEYTEIFSGENYYKKYKQEDCFQKSEYSYIGKDGNQINKTCEVKSADKIVENIAKRYRAFCMTVDASASTSPAVNINSKLTKQQINAYLDKAKKEGADEDQVAVLSYALARCGWSYSYGAAHTNFISNPNPKAYDCSSFVSYSWAYAGYSVSGSGNTAVATGGLRALKSSCGVSRSELKPGDIGVTSGGGSGEHAVIYLGDGKTIEAKSKASGIGIGNWGTRYDSYIIRPSKGIKKQKKLIEILGKYK